MLRWSPRRPVARGHAARRRAAALLRRYRRICRELGFHVVGRWVRPPKPPRSQPGRVARIEGVVMLGIRSARVKLARHRGFRPSRPVRVMVVA